MMARVRFVRKESGWEQNAMADDTQVQRHVHNINTCGHILYPPTHAHTKHITPHTHTHTTSKNVHHLGRQYNKFISALCCQ